MNKSVEQLMIVLNKELDLHALLIAAAYDMNAAVKKKNVAGVAAATRRYDDCTCSIEQLEEQRLLLCDTICKDAVKNGTHASLLTTIQHIDAPLRKTVTALRDQLKQTILDLSKINYSNQILITETITANHALLELITAGNPAQRGGYKKHGAKITTRHGMSLVNKVA